MEKSFNTMEKLTPIQEIFIYLFINYNTITNYILIIYELSNFDHLLGVVHRSESLVGIEPKTLTLIV